MCYAVHALHYTYMGLIQKRLAVIHRLKSTSGFRNFFWPFSSILQRFLLLTKMRWVTSSTPNPQLVSYVSLNEELIRWSSLRWSKRIETFKDNKQLCSAFLFLLLFAADNHGCATDSQSNVHALYYMYMGPVSEKTCTCELQNTERAHWCFHW